MQQLKEGLIGLISRSEREAEENADDPQTVAKCEEKVERARLRLSLMERGGDLSLLRLAHLEEIFKHYCANVFRVGKHMTFDRLEYDRVHMTLDRFALFLRDFQLTSFTVQGKTRELLSKQVIVSVFKKVSANCRELSFEEFIQCIEKLAIIYFDLKTTYFERQEQEQREKRKRQALVLKNKARREQAVKDVIGGPPPIEESKEKEEGEEMEEKEEEKEEQQGDGKESQVKSIEQFEKPVHNYNDELVNQLLNDKSLEDPNEEVALYAQEARRQKKEHQDNTLKQAMRQQMLLELTPAEKAEFFYSLINVDTLDDFKHKLTLLHLPIFKTTPEELYFRREQSNHIDSSPIDDQTKDKGSELSPDEQERILQLKRKMLMQKQKNKTKPLPKPSNQQALKESQNAKRRRELKKQREEEIKMQKEDKVKTIKNTTPSQPPVEFKETQISWDMLEKINIDQLKLRQFNPAKMFTPSEDDLIYLNEYGGSKAMKSIEIREKLSHSVAENVKKRADQVHLTEQKQEKQIRRRALA